ncbi:hypothetical protein YB2330_004852 [Saitoella coloradoensis]
MSTTTTTTANQAAGPSSPKPPHARSASFTLSKFDSAHNLSHFGLSPTDAEASTNASAIDEGFFTIPITGTGTGTADPIRPRRLDPLHTLPPELCTQIFSYLPIGSISSANLVSRAWHAHITHTPSLWRSLFSSQPTWSVSPSLPPGSSWRELYRIRHGLEMRWKNGEYTGRWLKGHGDSVYCVQFDKEKIVTGSRDRTIKVWDARSLECVQTLAPPPPGSASGVPFHTASVLCLQFNRDILVSGSSDAALIMWVYNPSLQTWAPRKKLQGHTAGVLDVCFAGSSYIVSCSKDTTICIWSRETGELVKILRGHRGPVNAVRSMKGGYVVSASGDWTVRVWDIRLTVEHGEDGLHIPNPNFGECVRELRGHARGLACVEVSPDGRYIVSGGNDQKIKIWSASTGECLHTLSGHSLLVRTLHLFGDRVISGSYDRRVCVWDLETGALRMEFPKDHGSWIFCVKGDLGRVVSTSQDCRGLVLDFWGEEDWREGVGKWLTG